MFALVFASHATFIVFIIEFTASLMATKCLISLWGVYGSVLIKWHWTMKYWNNVGMKKLELAVSHK